MAKEARSHFKAVDDCRSSFLKEVKILIQIGGNKKRIENIISSLSKTKRRAKILWKVLNPNFENLLEFIREMKRALSRIDKAYQLFIKKFETAIQFISDTASDCEEYAGKAQVEKDKAISKGTITTIILTGLALLLGAAAGVATAGVATIGIAVATGAATAVVAGAVTAVIGGCATIKIAGCYEDRRQAFNNQLATLNGFRESASKIEGTVKTLHLKVEFLERAVDKIDIQPHSRKKRTLDALCENLSHLHDFCSNVQLSY